MVTPFHHSVYIYPPSGPATVCAWSHGTGAIHTAQTTTPASAILGKVTLSLSRLPWPCPRYQRLNLYSVPLRWLVPSIPVPYQASLGWSTPPSPQGIRVTGKSLTKLIEALVIDDTTGGKTKQVTLSSAISDATRR